MTCDTDKGNTIYLKRKVDFFFGADSANERN